ncbi:hypothetical protein BXZ70DRAFT_917118 [Cristinia sonorae]|uniref:PUB domain-containing protein n=1 Tax=Cristinia sonorae TaxID=1940300 RepID=A0A8K0UWP5_9AGAR|nr:hypothetical protein BXZ70DRAFT_917118 [Cristinia sonorae]
MDVDPNPNLTASTTGPAAPPTPSSSSLADAIERRLRQQQQQQAAAQSIVPVPVFDSNYEKRLEFRRLIDPGIMRHNAKHIAMESLRILERLSDNILEHPDETKYYKFKPTNEKIKTFLVEPKGTLEYAVALGFHPEVENFQPFYIFRPRHMGDLQIGNAVIKEVLHIEEAKIQLQERARQEEKAARDAVKDKVKQAFIDDRKSTANRLQREAAARAARGSRPEPPKPTVRRQARMPGSGQTLTGQVVPETPPPYSRRGEDGEDGDEESEGEE